MLSNTAPRSAANARPISPVNFGSAAIWSTTFGKSASATKLGSKPAFSAAFCSSVPFTLEFCLSHALSSASFAGVPAHTSICASKASG